MDEGTERFWDGWLERACEALERMAAAAERIAEELEARNAVDGIGPAAPFLCVVCGKACAQPPDLTRTFVCSVCGMANPARR